MEVKFNKELTNLDGLTFTAKRGESSVVLTPKLSEDKKSVELSSSTNLVAGNYTVAVTGGKFEDGKNSGTVKVEAQKIGKIEFNSDTLAKTGTGTATVGFTAYDQYGTDITGSASSLINAINWSANVAVDSLNDANGVLTIDLAGATDFVKDQKILITATDSATGVSKAVNFNVGDASAVKTLSLGDVKLPKDTTRVYTGSASAATVEIAAEDQYGNKLDKASKLSGITVLSSDSSVIPTVTDDEDKTVISLDTTALTTAKKVTLTVVINATGETVSKTIEIVKPSQPDTVTLGNLESNVVANGDAAGEFVLPITVVNQFGETMTAKQVAQAFSAGDLTVTGTGSLGSTTGLTVDTNSNSENYGKVVNTGAVVSSGVGTVVVTTATGKTASANFDVKDARKVVEVVAPKKVTTNLVSGADSSFEYQYKDQYGDLITPAAANRNSDLTWKFVVTDLTGDSDVISVNKSTGADEDGIGKVTVSSAAGKSGTAKVAAQLLNSSNEVVSQVETTFKVSANNADDLTYSVNDVKTLYSNSAADTGVTGSDAYAAPLSIVAKDASGDEYTIPSSQIVKVESVKGNTVVSGTGIAPLGDVTLDNQDNKFVIGAVDSDNITWASGSNTVTDTIRVTLNTADGVKVLTKEVTISKASPKAEDIKVVDTDLVAGNPYELASTAKELTTITFADRTAAEAGSGAFVLVKDQYGVWTKKAFQADKVILNSTGLATANIDADNGFEFVGGKFILDEAANAAATANIRYLADTTLKYTIVDGDKTATVNVKITAEEAPSILSDNTGSNGTANAGKIAAGETSVITFSEELSNASKDAIASAAKTAYDAVKGAGGWATTADGTHGSVGWSISSGKSVLTITASGDVVANTVTIPTFTLNNTAIVDAIGNKAGTTGTVTVTPAS